MTYTQKQCLQGDYFECSDTSVVESEPENIQNDLTSLILPLDTRSYQSVEKSISEPAVEEVRTPICSIDTAYYRETSVRKISYRVTKN